MLLQLLIEFPIWMAAKPSLRLRHVSTLEVTTKRRLQSMWKTGLSSQNQPNQFQGNNGQVEELSEAGLVFDLGAHIVKEERKDVGCFLDILGHIARAMAGSGLNSDECRILPRILLLKRGDELE